MGKGRGSASSVLVPSNTAREVEADQGPLSRLPPELLRKIGEELPLDSLAHFAAINKEANRAVNHLLRKAREALHKAGQYEPRVDLDAIIFLTHCAEIAGLPKNHRIKPLLRLTQSIERLPRERGLLGAVRTAAILSAGMPPEQKTELRAALHDKLRSLYGEYMTGFQILAMNSAGLIPEQDDWVEPKIQWQRSLLPAEERLAALQVAVNEVKPWLPKDRRYAAFNLIDWLEALPEHDRLPAFRLLVGMVTELPPQDATAGLNGLRRKIGCLPAADLHEGITVLMSHQPSAEPDRFDYVKALVHSVGEARHGRAAMVFRAFDVREMPFPLESKVALLKVMTEFIARLPEPNVLEGLRMAVEQCAGLPFEEQLELVPTLLQASKHSTYIDRLPGFQLTQSMGKDMPVEGQAALLKILIDEYRGLPSQKQRKAFTGILADIRELPLTLKTDLLDFLVTGFNPAAGHHGHEMLDEVQVVAKDLNPRDEAALLEKIAGKVRYFHQVEGLLCLHSVCHHSQGLVEELRTGVLVALAENVKYMHLKDRSNGANAIKRMIPALPPVWGEEVMNALPEDLRSPLRR